ncbi:MAG: GntR family transcriptional regulator [Muribaculaceae bacterium]
MIKLGKFNTMCVVRLVDFGAYLGDPDDEKSAEILLPARYMPEDLRPGDTIDVFVYRDNENRPIATTDEPYATVGEFAYMQVNQVNDIGAFLDWGLVKELLVPFSEQKAKMRPGGIYLVYVYLDDATQRIVASAKIEKFLGNVFPEYKIGQRVRALVYQHTDIGYKAIVDNLHQGLLYENELFRPVELEETVEAYVKRVRPDGKIDLTLSSSTRDRVDEISDRIIEYLRKPDASAVSDHLSPEEIRKLFGCSKKDFKKAVGMLYRSHAVSIGSEDKLIRLSGDAL